MPQELPPGAREIQMNELLACIGELYLQTRLLREQLDAIKREGTLSNNYHEEREESKTRI